MRRDELKRVTAMQKLYLVVDLDHTMLNSAKPRPRMGLLRTGPQGPDCGGPVSGCGGRDSVVVSGCFRASGALLHKEQPT
jgi:hypothetical protein